VRLIAHANGLAVAKGKFAITQKDLHQALAIWREGF
jgi:hypothetical protein